MMETMLEHSLQETLCNLLRVINAASPRLSDLGNDERLLLIEDVQHFFTIIAERTFRYMFTHDEFAKENSEVLKISDIGQSSGVFPRAKAVKQLRIRIGS